MLFPYFHNIRIFILLGFVRLDRTFVSPLTQNRHTFDPFDSSGFGVELCSGGPDDGMGTKGTGMSGIG